MDLALDARVGVEAPSSPDSLAERASGDGCAGFVDTDTEPREAEDGVTGTASSMAGEGDRGGVGVGGTISAGFTHCVLPVTVLW